MLEIPQFARLKPLLIFFIAYSALFFLLVVTLKYTFPFVIGFLFALLVQPMIRALKSHLRLKSGAAAALSTIIVFVILFGLLFLLGYWLVYEANNLLNYITGSANTGYKSLTSPVEALLAQGNVYLKNIDAKFIQQNKEQLLGMIQSGVGAFAAVLGTTVNFLTSFSAVITMFIVMIFSTYFFSKDMSVIKAHVMSMFSENTVLNIHSASRHGLSMSGKYIYAYLLIYFITFLETLIVFTTMGIPYPLVLSIITGIADVLPILGPGTVYIPLGLIYLVCGDFFKAGALIIGWLLITCIRQIIEPKIVSASINVHPLTMLAAIYFALIGNNFWLLLYFSFLVILYQVFTRLEILPTLFEQKSIHLSMNTD